jgi:hypothetical protein
MPRIGSKLSTTNSAKIRVTGSFTNSKKPIAEQSSKESPLPPHISTPKTKINLIDSGWPKEKQIMATQVEFEWNVSCVTMVVFAKWCLLLCRNPTGFY